MPSPQPIIHAMTEVNKEQQTHVHRLSDPGLDASDRKAIGTCAAEGVRRGLTLAAMHQRLLQQRLEDLQKDVDWLEKSLKGGSESASP